MEALATRRAMELALETSLNKGVLEGDSQILINALTTNSHTLSQFGHIVNDIRYLASHFSRHEQFPFLLYKSGWKMYHQRLQMYFRLIFTTIVNKAFGVDSKYTYIYIYIYILIIVVKIKF